MNQNDATDRSIDEALRLAAGGQPPTGYLDRLQRRIKAAPEAHGTRAGSRLWALAACAVAAAAFLAIFLPGFLHSSKPANMSAANLTVQESKTSNLGVTQRLKPHLVAELPAESKPVTSKTEPPRRRITKTKRAAKPDAANLFDYPLTHQEKLLIEFARTATPEELQALNPEYQAKLEAKREAELAAYFGSGEVSGNKSASRNEMDSN